MSSFHYYEKQITHAIQEIANLMRIIGQQTQLMTTIADRDADFVRHFFGYKVDVSTRFLRFALQELQKKRKKLEKS